MNDMMNAIRMVVREEIGAVTAVTDELKKEVEQVKQTMVTREHVKDLVKDMMHEHTQTQRPSVRSGSWGPGNSSKREAEGEEDEHTNIDTAVVIKGFEPFSTRDEIKVTANNIFGKPESIKGAKNDYYTFEWRGNFCMLEFDSVKQQI